jgi:aromatic-L-amino-acid/L-tryptophan decarboxylase
LENSLLNDLKDFRRYGHEFVDWMADYLENIENYPVKSQVKPKEIISRLPDKAPQQGETIEQIFEDFKTIILPGMTHWQHPNFHAYFPANSSYPSVLAEMLTATLAAQCMMWETSPSAAELEEQVMLWLRDMLGLPQDLQGVIQDTASASTLCAILTAREKVSNFNVNKYGFKDNSYKIYCSSQTHSSIDKAVKIAGLGIENLVKVAVDEKLAMQPAALQEAIRNDQKEGKKPLCVIATFGTTGTTAVDPIQDIAKICQACNVWLHVDAAYAGNALLLPEMRPMAAGIEAADSFVVNPHKWMFTNFDCSAYFVKDRDSLIRTFTMIPEYLKTATTGLVNDYKDWGIALGRRFRALKLWFVIRSFGVEGLQDKLRWHIRLARALEEKIKKEKGFEILAPVNFNLICFRYIPDNLIETAAINDFNEQLLKSLNMTGKIYLTHTKINENYALRMVIGQTYVQEEHIDKAWALIKEKAKGPK